MKKLLSLLALTISIVAHSLNTDIVDNIHRNEYKVAEEAILSLLDGDDGEVIEASLLGLYLSLHTNNKEDLCIYYAILENLLRAIEIRNSSYWDGVLSE